MFCINIQKLSCIYSVVSLLDFKIIYIATVPSYPLLNLSEYENANGPHES